MHPDQLIALITREIQQRGEIARKPSGLVIVAHRSKQRPGVAKCESGEYPIVEVEPDSQRAGAWRIRRTG